MAPELCILEEEVLVTNDRPDTAPEHEHVRIQLPRATAMKRTINFNGKEQPFLVYVPATLGSKTIEHFCNDFKFSHFKA